MEPKKGLLDLPMELLSGLADFLTESDVNSLSQGSRQLYDGLNRSLYWNNARYFGSSALIRASVSGNSATAKRFFETVTREGTILITNNDTTNAWFEALQYGHKGVAEIILEKVCIDVNAKIHNGRTPLYIAAEFGHTALVRLLLNTGKVDIDADFSVFGTPLSAAARHGHVEVAKLLLDTGRADTEAVNLMGETPLYSAAKNGQVAVVQLFLDRGVDLEAILDGGPTLGQALVDIARRGGHEGVVKLILKS